MKILGIDYGRRKVGLAVSEGKLAEPYKVIRYKDLPAGRQVLSDTIKLIILNEHIEKVVIGLSEGLMGEETKRFASTLNAGEKALKIEFFDETLSTQEAHRLSIEAGLKRKKRKRMEDAYAACILLQNYLDSMRNFQ